MNYQRLHTLKEALLKNPAEEHPLKKYHKNPVTEVHLERTKHSITLTLADPYLPDNKQLIKLLAALLESVNCEEEVTIKLSPTKIFLYWS